MAVSQVLRSFLAQNNSDSTDAQVHCFPLEDLTGSHEMDPGASKNVFSTVPQRLTVICEGMQFSVQIHDSVRLLSVRTN